MADENGKLNKLEAENESLKNAIEELSIINDISTAINSTLSLEKIIELIVQKCIKHMKVEQGTTELARIKERKTVKTNIHVYRTWRPVGESCNTL